ncbi:DNA phosphorothioation system restriction enzyme [Exiguobacterium aestuarii]|uniref:DNA phosphorothioation system restriction enzyme n=1 Tax=Exiguobacterium aestuarii TaxID=273527 RepID=A0ABW2PMF7_9BACL|nr:MULTISPECIES: DNA phosphorothioation system restriction enzyme [Exiguobacterium]MCT4784772.1 DNA phosphorothioation system restriction enzyme [Exiguobacterium aestuarii]
MDSTILFPSLPKWFTPRDYQIDAIQRWTENGYHGLLEMATGTGKTLTALTAITKRFEETQRLVVVILCPYQHLVDQWAKDAKSFGMDPILCYGSKSQWTSLLSGKITQYNFKIKNFICVITTNNTFKNAHFQAHLSRISDGGMIVADEAHNLGTKQSLQSLPPTFKNRLALSATPVRHHDDIGTEQLLNYFGGSIYKFTLEEAIKKGFLTKYYYYPHLVSLTEDELEIYHDLTNKISKLINLSDQQSIEATGNNTGALEMLLIKRARLINSAQQKDILLKKQLKMQETLNHTIVYCGDHSKDDQRHVDHIAQFLHDDLNISAKTFTSTESKELRQTLLKEFSDNTIQALVAIRCLDEGVDVPSAETAYILASTTNPKEFIQRRGRILRKHPGKEYAYIHDYIVIPRPLTEIDLLTDKEFNIERRLLMNELKRVNEFASISENHYQALQILNPIKEAFNLVDL